jgi:hypothetical protein
VHHFYIQNSLIVIRYLKVEFYLFFLNFLYVCVLNTIFMIKIPSGKSNFKEVISGNFFYQDRTNYIKILEDFDSSYLIYLRPRRFGKSLMVSALNYYYGLQYKDQFNALFGNLFIGKNPTPLANQYLVLTFEFSGIDTTTAKSTMEGFLTNVHYWIIDTC